eukprot:GHVQ01006220.1.p1 GENE.GHVQ01006220.1~~GHVQ01006220.1.p1  ORF type:complete len:904 (+),score=63.26 GHVQ01006220.1:1717-4428(+)
MPCLLPCHAYSLPCVSASSRLESDKRYGAYSRAVTFEGPVFASHSVPLRGRHIRAKIANICRRIAHQLHVSSLGQSTVERMLLYFTVDCNNTVWLLWCSGIRLKSSDRRFRTAKPSTAIPCVPPSRKKSSSATAPVSESRHSRVVDSPTERCVSPTTAKSITKYRPLECSRAVNIPVSLVGTSLGQSLSRASSQHTLGTLAGSRCKLCNKKAPQLYELSYRRLVKYSFRQGCASRNSSTPSLTSSSCGSKRRSMSVPLKSLPVLWLNIGQQDSLVDEWALDALNSDGGRISAGCPTGQTENRCSTSFDEFCCAKYLSSLPAPDASALQNVSDDPMAGIRPTSPYDKFCCIGSRPSTLNRLFRTSMVVHNDKVPPLFRVLHPRLTNHDFAVFRQEKNFLNHKTTFCQDCFLDISKDSDLHSKGVPNNLNRRHSQIQLCRPVLRPDSESPFVSRVSTASRSTSQCSSRLQDNSFKLQDNVLQSASPQHCGEGDTTVTPALPDRNEQDDRIQQVGATTASFNLEGKNRRSVLRSASSLCVTEPSIETGSFDKSLQRSTSFRRPTEVPKLSLGWLREERRSRPAVEAPPIPRGACPNSEQTTDMSKKITGHFQPYRQSRIHGLSRKCKSISTLPSAAFPDNNSARLITATIKKQVLPPIRRRVVSDYTPCRRRSLNPLLCPVLGTTKNPTLEDTAGIQSVDAEKRTAVVKPSVESVPVPSSQAHDCEYEDLQRCAANSAKIDATLLTLSRNPSTNILPELQRRIERSCSVGACRRSGSVTPHSGRSSLHSDGTDSCDSISVISDNSTCRFQVVHGSYGFRRKSEPALGMGQGNCKPQVRPNSAGSVMMCRLLPPAGDAHIKMTATASIGLTRPSSSPLFPEFPPYETKATTLQYSKSSNLSQRIPLI